MYSIGPAALDLLEEEFGFSREQLKQSLEKNKLSSMFLRHFLMPLLAQVGRNDDENPAPSLRPAL